MGRIICRPVLLLLLYTFGSVAEASYRCNSNDHCMKAWVCIGGTANNGDSSFTGTCRPNAVLTQVCNVHHIASSKFAKAVFLLALVMLSVEFFSAKVEWTKFVTIVIGTALVFGSLQIVALVTSDYRPACQFRNVN